MNERNKEAIDLANDIIVNLEKTPYDILNLMKFYRLVSIFEMNDEKEWIMNEQHGYKNAKFPDYRHIYKGVFTNYYIASSYQKIDSYRLENKTLFEGLYNITPEDFIPVLQTVNSKVYYKTTDILNKLRFEKTTSDIFEETRETVDNKLSSICPTTFEKLRQLYENAIESKSELDIKQVALGCRDILKDFADSICPPTNEKFIGLDEKQHTLKEDDYMNRIMFYVQSNTISETNQDFMLSHIQYLFSFLENVNKLANKGTHKGIPKEQANRCVIYTYLALGDIINLCSV